MTTLASKARLPGINPARLGRCYELACRFVLDEAPPGATLVHGSIQVFNNPRINHAWVNDTKRGVWEPASNMWWGPDTWDAMFNPKEYQVYTVSGARRQMLKAEHWGPWDKASEKEASNGNR